MNARHDGPWDNSYGFLHGHQEFSGSYFQVVWRTGLPVFGWWVPEGKPPLGLLASIRVVYMIMVGMENGNGVLV